MSEKIKAVAKFPSSKELGMALARKGNGEKGFEGYSMDEDLPKGFPRTWKIIGG